MHSVLQDFYGDFFRHTTRHLTSGMLEANFPEDQTTQRHAVNAIVLTTLGETQLSSAMLTIPFLGEKQVSFPIQSSV